MLNDKACAIALIDRHKKSGSLLKKAKFIIESQYTKSDTIFYKFKNTNIAISKRLNHLDFSILSEEDWTYLLDTVNAEYIATQKNHIDNTAILFTAFIDEWSKEHSIITKMHQFMNNRVLNESGAVNKINTLNDNKKILKLLLNNKVTLEDSGSHYSHQGNEIVREPSMDIDVFIDRVSDGANFEKVDILVTGTDNNISVVRDRIITPIPTAIATQTNKINLIIGLLIIKYNRDRNNAYNDNEWFQEHYKTIYRLKTNYNSRGTIEEFKKEHRNQLIKAISGKSYGNMLQAVLYDNGYYYGYGWDLRRTLGDSIVNLSIDYTSMTNEHLILFKECVEWLIKRHAKYITTIEKTREAYMLFLGRNILEGKKRTKEVLSQHLNLENMTIELERRGL